MMRVYLIELRRSPLTLWFPIFLLLDLASVFGRSRWWIGVWPQASAAAQIPSMYFAPVLAAGAAWAATRTYRGRFDENIRTAAIARWRIEAAQAGVTLTLGLAAYAVGVLAAAGVSFRDAGPGFLWPGYILLGVSVMILSVGIGHLAGRVFASPFATPAICGLGMLVVFGSVRHRIDFYVLSGAPQLRVSAGALMARLLLASGVLACALLVPGVTRRSGSRWRVSMRSGAPAGLALSATVVGLLAVMGSGPLAVERPAATHPVCTSTAPRVCFWPENRKYLRMASAMMRRLNAIPAGLLSAPDAFYERGLRDFRQYPYDFMIHEGSSWSISGGMTAAIQQMTLPRYCPAKDRAAEERRMLASFELSQWIESRLNGEGQPSNVHGGPPGVDLSTIERLIRQPEDVQAIWFHEHLGVIRGTPCA